MTIIDELCAIADGLSDQRGVIKCILQNQIKHGELKNVREFSYGVLVEMEVSDSKSKDLEIMKQFRTRLKAHIYGECP